MGGQMARLELELCCEGGHTRPRTALATPPLQLSRARYDDVADRGRLSLTLLHLGGILAGDSYELRVAAGARARAAVVGAAATPVYAMPGGEASQRITLCAEPGAALWWQPGPLILYGGAAYSQATTVVLRPGGLVVVAELLVAGRLARGERWQFGRYASLLEVVDGAGELLAAERVLIEPGRRSPAVAGAMGEAGALGTLWLLGDGFDHEAAARAAAGCPGVAGAAVLPGGCGVAVRALGASLAAAQVALLRSAGALTAAGLIAGAA